MSVLLVCCRVACAGNYLALSLCVARCQCDGLLLAVVFVSVLGDDGLQQGHHWVGCLSSPSYIPLYTPILSGCG